MDYNKKPSESDARRTEKEKACENRNHNSEASTARFCEHPATSNYGPASSNVARKSTNKDWYDWKRNGIQIY